MFLPQHGIATKCICFHMRGSREGQGVQTPSLIKHKIVGFLSNTGPDPHKNIKDTKPSFNVWPSSVRRWNAVWLVFCLRNMAFRWRSYDGPLLALFGSSLPSSEKECCQRWNRIRTCFGLNSPLDHPQAERYLFHMCIKRSPNTKRIYMLSIVMGRGEDTCCCQSNGRVVSMWKKSKDKICNR